MSGWHDLERTKGGWAVHLKKHEGVRFWPPAVLRDDPLDPALGREGSQIVVDGQSTVWMYAHVGCWAAAGRAARLRIIVLNDPAVGWELGPASAEAVDPAWIERVELEGDALGLLIREHPQRKWPVVGPDPVDLGRDLSVCMTGRGAVWMYAWMGSRAVASGAARVHVLQPLEGGLVQVWPPDESLGSVNDPREEWARSLGLAEHRSPCVLGVAGDPNCGKSVFSYALDQVRQALRLAGWRYDCDAASPTPPWYLEHVQVAGPEAAGHLRRKNKVGWSAELDRIVADQVKRLAGWHRLLIADLPGGLHRSGQAPQRIPEGREETMKKITHFVLIARADEPEKADAWREDLERWGLADRIVATVLSESHEAQPALVWEARGAGPWRGVARGLDRLRALAELPQAMKAAIEQLFSAKLGLVATRD